MKRIVAFISATLALVACSNPMSPKESPEQAKAKASLHAASKGPMVSGRLAGN